MRSTGVGRVLTWRRALVAVGLCCFGGLLAAIAWVTAYLQPPQSVGLSVVGADYANNLHTPHNAWGWNGLVSACGLRGGADSLRLGGELLIECPKKPTLADESFGWADATEQLNEDVAVVLVSLHGGCDNTGPFLLRSDADPADAPARRLRVGALLAELRKLPPEQFKLVVFDATQEPGLTPFGVLSNRFAEGLRELNTAIEAIPNLVVISASHPGERSWREPAAGKTIFLNTFIEGLRGAAQDVDQNGRISGRELAEYLRATVKARAGLVHRREQKTMLLPEGDESFRRLSGVDLALANPGYRATPLAGPAIEQRTVESLSKRIELVGRALRQPETTAPIAWRRLRLLRLRHEQLLAAGSPELARSVAEAAESLASELELVAARLDRDPDPIQLAAAIPGTGKDDIVDPLIAKLLKSPASEARSAWELVSRSVPSEEVEQVRRQVFDQLLDHLEDAPCARLQQTAGAIAAVSPRSGVRPAEAHLVVMMAEGLPQGLDDERWDHPLRVAVKTRRLAERVASDGGVVEQGQAAEVLAWVATDLAEADGLRRQGEDLLFCGEQQLPQAENALEHAVEIYDRLQQEAGKVRAGMAARDAAFAVLPRYTEAVVGLSHAARDDQQNLLQLCLSVEEAWESAHALSDLLVEGPGATEVQPTGLAQVERRRLELEKSLFALRSLMQSWQADLIERSGPALWNNRDAALIAPELETSQRIRLLSVTPPSVGQAPLDQRGAVLSQAELAKWRQVEQRCRARLAVAAVGKRRFDQHLDRRQGYEAAMSALLTQTTSTADAAVVSSVEVNLQRIRRVVRASSLQAKRLAADLEQNESGYSSLLAAADADLRVNTGADYCKQRSLPSELTRVQLYRFLLNRAERVLEDGWNSEEGVATAYSELAATTYLAQAERLLPGRSATDRLSNRARRPVSLAITSPERVSLVSGVAPPFSCGVEGAMAGAAALSVEAADGVRVVTPSKSARRAVCIRGNVGAFPQVVVAADGRDEAIGDMPVVETRRLSLRAWQRGHRASREVDVVVYHRPDYQSNSPPPVGSAGVTVVASGMDKNGLSAEGGIAFVLDASGSMGPVGDAGSSKYVQAVDALTSLLMDTPAGVQVSVWVFGQAVGSHKTVANAEATVRQVLAPTRWDPQNQELVRRLTAMLAYPRIEPWNESPLGRAIIAAAKDLREIPGYRSVVAITDGLDNRIESDGLANPEGATLGEVLQDELAGAGVSLQVIGFRVAASEQEAARAQFAFLPSLSPPGRWWEAEERSTLEQQLRSVFRFDRTIQLTSVNADHGQKAIAAKVAPQADPFGWQPTPIPPGAYVLDSGSDESAKNSPRVVVDAGDHLLLKVVQGGDRSTFAPTTLGALQWEGKPSFRTDQWRGTIVSHRKLPNDATCWLLALEREWDSGNATQGALRVVRPSRLWIESEHDSAGAWCWKPVYGYAAPCYEVTRFSTQSQSSPGQLSVWWTAKEDSPASLSLRREQDFQSLAELTGRNWELDAMPLVVNRVDVESGMLPDSTGKLVEQSSLIIELSCKHPVMVNLLGANVPGSDFKVYTEAGRSVARFWPLTRRQVAATVKGLSLTSLADFKRHAESRQQMLRIHDLPPPTPTAPRPLPAVGWLGASNN
ncbi:hypothetical protein KOR34_14330 [Posidoniimonas corsicana]|uniref:VWFA domain-containing protein n=1 Tax=Posidoniimonas corsicana TaxID=1938618 RepID=A0A5C5VF18_9BACT|nr:hypothetical protein KOR34_14330 [Posidoniimonas corsicana]